MTERFESQFNRVVGGSEEEKKKGIERYNELLNDFSNDLEDEYKQYEVEKSENEIRAIQETEQDVDTMLQNWGGDSKQIPLGKIHIVKEKSIPIISKERFYGGYHMSAIQGIVIERVSSEIAFRKTVAHEMFHQKSYKSAQVYNQEESSSTQNNETRSTKAYRLGFGMVDRKNQDSEVGRADVYFAQLEEAIVATSANNYIKQNISKDPRFGEAFARAEKLKDWLRRIPDMFPDLQRNMDYVNYIYALDGGAGEKLIQVLESDEENDYKLGFCDRTLEDMDKERSLIYADRIIEIEKINVIFDAIIAESKGEFKNREEVFDLFATANYSGNILPVGRVIEKYLGKGTFRKIGEATKKEGKKG